MEIHKEEMAELLKEIKEKSKIIAVTKKTGEEPEERQ